jgi:8-oxo-dGTP diphosphatase
MNASGVREIACAILIDTRGRFLLQQRGDVAGILYPGKVSLFGGHREGGETFLQCAVREIHEEISYFVQRIGLIIWQVEGLIITKGSLLVSHPDEIIGIEHKLTPAARIAMKALRGIRILRRMICRILRIDQLFRGNPSGENPG